MMTEAELASLRRLVAGDWRTVKELATDADVTEADVMKLLSGKPIAAGVAARLAAVYAKRFHVHAARADEADEADPATGWWRLALHEAAHAIVALSEGVVTERLILHADRGSCRHGECGLFTSAMISAGGKAGEALAEGTEPPIASEAALAKLVDEQATVDADPIGVWMRPNGVPDWYKIALWAIAVPEPDRWAWRVHWVEALAAAVIQRHRLAVLRIAEALYIEGRIDGERLQELLSDTTKLLVDNEVDNSGPSADSGLIKGDGNRRGR